MQIKLFSCHNNALNKNKRGNKWLRRKEIQGAEKYATERRAKINTKEQWHTF